MTELGELRTQLLERFDRGLNFLLDHRLASPKDGAAALICDQAARRLLQAASVEEKNWASAVHQSWRDCVEDDQPQTAPAPTNSNTKGRGNRELNTLLDGLDELDRQIVLRYYRDGEEKSTICRALELSDYHFNQILARIKQHYVRGPTGATKELSNVAPVANHLDRYLLGRCSAVQATDTEIALLERPALVHEAQISKKLIGDLRQAHLPRRWRSPRDERSSQVKGRLGRRRRGIWRFLTRPCLGAAASVVCIIGIFASWAMWDTQQLNALMNQPSWIAVNPTTVPLRIAQTRGYRPSTFLELPADANIVSVSLDIGTPQNLRYRVSLIDADGDMLWQQHDVTPSDDESLRFVVSSQVLTTGVHRFLVEPIDEPGHRIQLAFQVETPDSALDQ